MALNQNQKNNSQQTDVIIVGQGIAGSVLAFSLIRAGYSVCVINQPALSSCSTTAAGIWNPIVFKRLTNSWLADTIVPELIAFYTACEKELHTTLLYKRSIIKPLNEEQEKSLWLKKAIDNPFLDGTIYENLSVTDRLTIPSYSNVLLAGNIDTAKFLNEMKIYISETQTYIEEEFVYDDVILENDRVRYHSHSAQKIIFCDGHLISKNPFFKWIPMKPAKGETVTIHCKGIHIGDAILNKGIFILPLGNDTYKIGATYEWETLTDEPTEKGLAELEQKLKTIITLPYTILKQEAGIRPAVIDRRPVIGQHPIHQQAYIFNGFGTKAVMLAPYFAKELTQFIQTNSAIHPEVSPLRFYQK